MAKLNIRLLGPIQFDEIDEPLSGFDSDKVRALLAYLVLESSRSHRREFLAGLFWPDFSERSARTNLRRALANLRDITGDRQTSPPFFNITRQTIQFNQASNYILDITEFKTLIEEVPGRHTLEVWGVSICWPAMECFTYLR